MKITVIGYSGGGKTTLAKKIARKFNIPHQQIDRIWFEAGGHTAKSDSEKERVRKIIEEKVVEFSSQKSWVSDGFYSRVQGIMASKADYVVVIELPLVRRLINHWRRIIFKEDRHPEVSAWQDFWHSIEIVKRTFTFRKKLENFKKQYSDKLVVLKSFREIDSFFEKL
jgi:adenylate kinase family enzyme